MRIVSRTPASLNEANTVRQQSRDHMQAVHGSHVAGSPGINRAQGFSCTVNFDGS